MRELFDHHPRAGHLDVRNLGYWCLHEDCGHAAAPRVAATPSRILGGRSAGAIRLRAIANGSIGWMEPTMWCSLSAPGFRTATSQRIWSNSQSRICCCPCWLPLSAHRSARAARSPSGRARLLTVPGSRWRCAGRSASFAVTPRSTCWLGCFIRNRSTTGTSRAATVGLRHQLRGVLARPIRQPRPAADRRKVLSRYSTARESRNEHAADPRLRPTAYGASAKARAIRRAASR